jgi:hypothetical protein
MGKIPTHHAIVTKLERVTPQQRGLIKSIFDWDHYEGWVTVEIKDGWVGETFPTLHFHVKDIRQFIVGECFDLTFDTLGGSAIPDGNDISDSKVEPVEMHFDQRTILNPQVGKIMNETVDELRTRVSRGDSTAVMQEAVDKLKDEIDYQKL